MKKILLSLFLIVFCSLNLSAQDLNMKEVVSKLQTYLNGVEENATIAISDEGVVTYTKHYRDEKNSYRAVFRLPNVKISLEERKKDNYIEGEPQYYMKFECESKTDPCIIYTKLSDESSTNSYKFTNFPVWTLENGEDAVKKLKMLKSKF
ncbi:hypothetical protein MATR_09130 [Marivirga tractuosa]|uniref:Uncharacterized protein n=1 Tax=Marivirga tractuosa (strain ATCC 23168 / DSM 4126 / NBRC 15989 / NCIMB 1408 / VKM B-1430 / H-43) TaxID=643867 RepID=E4TNM1_MARTH|nr:hypothetical protein [Marivirga tractuosa]ADR21458.1 hypothetical protein Ftrac_1468 [Marivirga tractuosa DSM 4126]BDD14088.1 hypothetical protein MATR_09130 [Marivirga tractuosa]